MARLIELCARVGFETANELSSHTPIHRPHSLARSLSSQQSVNRIPVYYASYSIYIYMWRYSVIITDNPIFERPSLDNDDDIGTNV